MHFFQKVIADGNTSGCASILVVLEVMDTKKREEGDGRETGPLLVSVLALLSFSDRVLF